MNQLLLLLPLLLILGSTQQPHKALISVTGQSSVTVDPTDVTVSFTVSTKDNEAGKALTENNRKLNSIVDAFKAINVTEEELGTSSFTINNIYESIYLNDHYESKFKGYEASQTLTVNTKKFNMAGKLIDTAITTNDATTVNSVNFFVSESIKKQIKNDLIEKAVLDAKNRANLALSVLDYQVDQIDSLNLNDFNDGGWDNFRPLMKSGDSTSIFSGASEISFSVSASFSIKKLSN